MLEQATHILNTTFGYPAFRGQQADIITRVVSGGDALVLMPTGGGKSLCYQIPALLRPGTGVVVSPLIALMKDQVDALSLLGVRAAYLNSTLTLAEVRQVERQLVQGELQLLYVAPERLLTPRCLELLDTCRLSLFAIDEAHCVSQWGHDFRPEYLGLSVLAERFAQVPRMALTATADAATRREMQARLKLEGARVFISSFDRPNIRYTVLDKQNAKSQFLRFYQSAHRGDAGIVYCLSRRSVDATAQWLTANGVTALPYHAGLNGPTRQRHQERFLREDGLVMVATVAFGMGIDKPDVRFVAHLDLPKSLEGYYQETGRAGRDGLAADAFMVYGLSDVITMRQMLASSSAPEAVKRVEVQKLEALLGYCESPRCRRQVLLEYFGETLAEPCGNCDTCLAPVDTWDGTVAAQKALSNVYRTGQRFGAGHLVDVLLGKDNARIKQLGHHRLSTYGIGQEHSEREWRAVLRQLVAAGYLSPDAEGHGSLKLTAKSTAVLKGQVQVEFRHDARPGKVKVGRDQATINQAKTGQTTTDQAPDAAALWDALRARRTELAKAQGVPPYVIFHDATLRQMGERRPQTPAELAVISGVGSRKLERYGDAFLEVLRAHAPAERPGAAPAPAYGVGGVGDEDDDGSDTVVLTKALLYAGHSPEQIAERRGLKVRTIYTHFAELVRRGDLTPQEATHLPEDDLRHIEGAYQTLPETERGRLKPLFERLEGRFDYDLLRCVVAGLE